MESKPLLFHDIDGVLFGHYGNCYQLRPGVREWLHWAHEHFEVIWLTAWEKHRIEALLDLLYIREHLPILVANCLNYENKVVWIEEAVPKLHGRNWFWVDDEIDNKFAPYIQAAGISPDHCIQCNPKGEDELVSAQRTLASRIMSSAGSMTRLGTDAGTALPAEASFVREKP